MTHVIEVTEEDIANGQPRIAFSCPVALAISRVTGRRATVSYSHIYLGLLAASGQPDWRLTPPALARWLHAYDNGEEVGPFSFDLDSLEACTPGESARLKKENNHES